MNGRILLSGFYCFCCLLSVSSSAATTPATTTRFYQLQAGAGYQQLNTVPVMANVLCPEPRPDTLPLQWRGHQGQQFDLQLSNEQGNLRWWNDTATESAVLLSESVGSASAMIPPQPAVGMPLLLLPSALPLQATQQVIAAPYQVVWHDPAAHQYQLVDFTDLQKPQQRWRWSPPLAQQQPWLQSPVLHMLEDEEPVLLINSSTSVKSLLWLLQAEKGQVLAEFDLNKGYQRGAQPVLKLSALTAAPAALDRDGDGALDRIYQIDQQGQLLRLDVAQDLSYQSALVADLTQYDGVFDHTILAARALLPMSTAGAKTLVSSKVVDLVVLVAQRQQQYQLFVLFLPDEISMPLLYTELVVKGAAQSTQGGTPNTIPSGYSGQGRAHGWQYELPGTPVVLPEIVAGVIYLPLQHSVAQGATASCHQARQADQLLALHLYQASAVYKDAVIQVPMQAPLQLVQQQNGTLALQDAAQVLVLDELRGIHQQCATCTEKLTVQQLSQWRQLALFRQEEVY